MNKKGFTLVELLAAITILSLLALLTVPAVTKPIKDSNQNIYDSQLRSFKDSAKGWGADNMFSNLPSVGNCLLVTLDVLQDAGLVEPNITNSLTSEEYRSTIENGVISGILIKISNIGNTEVNRYSYEVWDCDKNSCYNPDASENKNQDYTAVKDNCEIYEK